ncbi:MAG: mechanosensitive ion channel domain-containing protein [Cyanobacteria bacterium J06641_5]
MRRFFAVAARSLGIVALVFSFWLSGMGAVGWAAPAKQAIILDSRPVFEVSDTGDFSARDRAADATRILRNLTRDPDAPLRVAIEDVTASETGATVPILKVDGNHLISATSADTPAGRTAREQAEIWRQQLQRALRQAKFERSREYLLQSLPILAGMGLFAAAVSWGLLRLWRVWVLPWARRQSAATTEAPHTDTVARVLAGMESSPAPTPGPEVLARILLYLLQVMVWLAAATYVSERFPPTRRASRWLLDTVANSLTAKIVPLGDRSYSVLGLMVLLALLAAIAIAARNIQRLLRSRILSLTGLDRSTQATIAVIANYVFLFIGILVLLQLWGLDISSLTVFAGVLGVGVGLGLQGIAKEFVSGLVLIFERPVQVGDFIEVGDMAGTVENINLRSTEIQTVDRVSVIFPNSRLLEAEVVNWSHGNPISRLRIPLGVAYGSSLKQVQAALLQAAREHPDILHMPPPSVLFQGFGGSELSFELMVWIREPRKQFRIKSELYFRIDELFRDRHLEVPFPQHDVHVRTGSLPVELPERLTASLTQVAASLTDLLQARESGARDASSGRGDEPSDTPSLKT